MKSHNSRITLIIIPFSLLLTSCAVPSYDEKMDNQVSQLQISMDSGLGDIEERSLFYEQSIKNNATSKENVEKLKKQCTYETNYKFYTDTESSINSLLVRISVTPNIPQGPVNAIVAMRKNFQSLREMHASHQPCLKSFNFEVKRTQLNGDFYPIYNYLLQTKVGTSESKSVKSNN